MSLEYPCLTQKAERSLYQITSCVSLCCGQRVCHRFCIPVRGGRGGHGALQVVVASSVCSWRAARKRGGWVETWRMEWGWGRSKKAQDETRDLGMQIALPSPFLICCLWFFFKYQSKSWLRLTYFYLFVFSIESKLNINNKQSDNSKERKSAF